MVHSHVEANVFQGNQIIKNLFFNDLHKEIIHGMSGSLNKASLFNVSQSGWVKLHLYFLRYERDNQW